MQQFYMNESLAATRDFKNGYLQKELLELKDEAIA